MSPSNAGLNKGTSTLRSSNKIMEEMTNMETHPRGLNQLGILPREMNAQMDIAVWQDTKHGFSQPWWTRQNFIIEKCHNLVVMLHATLGSGFLLVTASHRLEQVVYHVQPVVHITSIGDSLIPRPILKKVCL